MPSILEPTRRDQYTFLVSPNTASSSSGAVPPVQQDRSASVSVRRPGRGFVVDDDESRGLVSLMMVVRVLDAELGRCQIE